MKVMCWFFRSSRGQCNVKRVELLQKMKNWKKRKYVYQDVRYQCWGMDLRDEQRGGLRNVLAWDWAGRGGVK